MMNPFHMNNVVAASESDSETGLARNTRQLPSQLAAQLPTFALKNSSDIHIGPRQQNNEPVTVNEYEYITVKGENDESLDQYTYDDIYITTPQTPESGRPVDVALKHLSNDVLPLQRHASLRNHYVRILLVFLLVAAIIIALFVWLTLAASNRVHTHNVNVTAKVLLDITNLYVHLYNGPRYVELVVNVTASSQPKLVWYGPNCKMLEERDGSIKFEVHTSPTGTELKLYNISRADRGVYRLQASNEEGEEWAYITLNVKDNVNVTVKILLEIKKQDVYVYEGQRSVQWVVNVTASSQPKLVWYGPNCKVLEGRDGSIKFEVHTSPTGTELKLNNISLADSGVYRLQASNGEGEEWAYFTLNVTDLFRLEVMMNPSHTNNVVATTESGSGIELAGNSRQLPTQLAAQLPTVALEKSSDIHIGPRQQNNEPVTVNQHQDITVTVENDIYSLDQYPHDDINNTTTQTPESGNPVDVALKQHPKDVMTFQKQACLRNPYVWSLLVFVLVAAIIIAFISSRCKPESNSAPPNNVNVTIKVLLEVENKEVIVNEGKRSVELVVNVTASSQPKLVWYGPNCMVLERRDGSIKFEVHTSTTGTELKLYNISVADRGVYRLQASNGEGEEWAYFTLNVKGKIPLGRQHVVMCYLLDWAHRRPGQGKFTVDNIDPTLCTHLVYAFAFLNMDTNAIEPSEPAYDLEEHNGTGAYRKMTSLKRDYPHLKVLLGMGGWESSWEKNYSEMAESPSRRMALVNIVSELLRKYNFDGLDLWWLYPAGGKGVPADKENFVSLLKEFREEFDKFGLLLTATLGVHPDTLQRSYDIPAVSQYLHYMFAQCYSYYGHWNPLTGPNAPLYPCCGDDNLNVESSINTFLLKGADPNKLVLVLPLFGRIFKLKNPDAGVGFEKESEGAGMLGPYKMQYGWWGYNEICLEVDNQTNNWTKYWDNVTHTPYASKGDQFISYDDKISLTDKVELAVRKKIAGVAVHSLDEDDFHGSCNFGSSGSTGYPLMRAINNALDNSVSWKKVPCTSRSSATNKPQNIDYN